MAKKLKTTPVIESDPDGGVRRQEGRDRRAVVPLAAHGEMPERRRDPIDIITDQDATRLPDLVPIRHGRMAVSPFAFYRATAGVMASDLSATPTTDLTLQVCGDAHIMNFGVFRGPDRRLVFDLNDFDETLGGPFEWDVKRFATSVTLAARHNGFKDKEIRRVTLDAVAAYRNAICGATHLGPLALNYRRTEVEPILESLQDPTMRKAAERVNRHAIRHDNIAAVDKLTEVVDGRRRIVEHRPQIVRIDDLVAAEGPQGVAEFYDAYARSLPPHHRYLLQRHSIVDIAHKIVGVGSVGTRCMIVLLESDDGHPLLMQFKEARASVLESFCESSPFDEHGERVVQGQRLMQATGDIFLGWARLHGGDDRARDFYFRQLWDGKGSLDPATLRPNGLSMYTALCGQTLALAHARTRNVESIAGYLGDDATFDEAIGTFAAGYADIVEDDFGAHAAAIASGRLHAVRGV
jgi:uncharacterized protein (DUF2252 family)